MGIRIFVLIIYFISFSEIYAILRQDLHLIIQQAKQPLDIVSCFIDECPKILEAGGRYGEDTVRMHDFWPNSTIYTFEPNPSAYKKLKQQIEGYDNIFSYPFALYNYDGIVKFHVRLNYGNEGASSILTASHEYSEMGPRYSWWYIDREIEVPCLTLDSWAKEEGIEEIDFMWLDMEGVELCVLKSGMHLLKNVKVIYTEVNFQEFRIEMTQYRDLKKFLNEQGFEQIFFEGDRTFQGNAIFVKKNLFSDIDSSL